MLNPLTLLEGFGFSKRRILAEYAQICVGKDLNGGTVDKDVACAVVVNNICNNALGFTVGGGASTYNMLQFLKMNPRWGQVKLEEAQKGDLIIAATGTRTAPSNISNGHVGYLADDVGDGICPTKIISNNSSSGLVDTHFTLGSFWQRYATEGKYPITIHRLLF